jgi:hypothetical protein
MEKDGAITTMDCHRLTFAEYRQVIIIDSFSIDKPKWDSAIFSVTDTTLGAPVTWQSSYIEKN